MELSKEVTQGKKLSTVAIAVLGLKIKLMEKILLPIICFISPRCAAWKDAPTVKAFKIQKQKLCPFKDWVVA